MVHMVKWIDSTLLIFSVSNAPIFTTNRILFFDPTYSAPFSTTSNVGICYCHHLLGIVSFKCNYRKKVANVLHTMYCFLQYHTKAFEGQLIGPTEFTTSLKFKINWWFQGIWKKQKRYSDETDREKCWSSIPTQAHKSIATRFCWQPATTWKYWKYQHP
jgi:hypothetical protein